MVVVVCKQGVQTRHIGDVDAHKFRPNGHVGATCAVSAWL